VSDDGSPKPEDRGGKGWRRAFLGLWTASFGLLLAFVGLTFQARIQNTVTKALNQQAPLPALTVWTMDAAQWIPDHIVLVGSAWAAGVFLGLLAPRSFQKPMAGVALLLLLAVVGLGALGIRMTDPAKVVPPVQRP
jgi:hypothetical protein